jgi:hypothetical protein
MISPSPKGPLPWSKGLLATNHRSSTLLTPPFHMTLGLSYPELLQIFDLDIVLKSSQKNPSSKRIPHKTILISMDTYRNCARIRIGIMEDR